MVANNLKIRHTPYDTLMSLLIVVSILCNLTSLNKYSASILLPAGLLVFSRKTNHLSNLNPFYYIIALGLLASLYSNNVASYYFVKDFVFFAQVPIIIGLGFYIGKRLILVDRLIKFVVLSYCLAMLADVVVVISHIDEFLVDPIMFHNTYKTNSVNAILVLIVILYQRDSKSYFISKFYIRALAPIVFGYILISFSRTTMLIALLVLLIFYIGDRSKKHLFYVILLTPLFVQFAGEIVSLDRDASNTGAVTFVGKLSNSLNELQIVDFDNQFDISNNWRGFEAFLGIEKYFSGDFFQLLIGQGFGASVKVPNWAFSNWNDPSLEGLRNPNIFHIGYVTILLKTGMMGLLLFVHFTSTFFAQGKLHGFNNFLSQSLIILIVTTTFLTHGLIKPDLNPLILIFLGISFRSLNEIKL